ncbi:hypothetical protein EAI_09895, partial [Harpegnathos saltator]
NERSYATVAQLFNETYPNRRINKSAVLKTMVRFRKTGSVNNRPKSGRPAINEEKQFDVLQTFIEVPNSTINRAAQTHNITPKSVRRILKKN